MRYIALAIAMFAASMCVAQNKLDSSARQFVETAAATDSVGVVVTFAGEEDTFAPLNVDVVSRVGRTAVVTVTPAQLEEIAALPQVVQVAIGYEARTLPTPAGTRLVTVAVPAPKAKYRSPGIFGGLNNR